MGKTVKMSFEGENKNGQKIDYSEKKKKAQGLHLPLPLGLNTIIFKHVYWYMQQILGERLQDHGSPGLNNGTVRTPYDV